MLMFFFAILYQIYYEVWPRLPGKKEKRHLGASLMTTFGGSMCVS
jgi:hypothetical protein